MSAFIQNYYVTQVREIEGEYTGPGGSIYEDSDACYSETWFDLEGCIHRDGDLPAVIVRRKDNNQLIGQEWWRHGQRHRDGGPAWIITSDDHQEIWYQNGEESRSDGPSTIRRETSTGVIRQESWCQAGLPHREDGPAVTTRVPYTGALIHEGWYRNGELHRVGAPASIDRDEDTGVVVEELWSLDGKRHREDGPAWIFRDAATGVAKGQRHYSDGVEVTAALGGVDPAP